MLIRLRRQDERALHRVIASRRSWVNPFMRGLTHLGDAGAAIPVIVLLLASGAPAVAAAGRVGAFTLLVSHLWVQLLKRSISRSRPHLPVGMEFLAAAPDRFSFPSGHAAAALSIALAAGPLVAGPLAALFVGVALLVGTSRCYLGVHYPGDVLAGWILALLAHTVAPFALAAVAG